MRDSLVTIALASHFVSAAALAIGLPTPPVSVYSYIRLLLAVVAIVAWFGKLPKRVSE